MRPQDSAFDAAMHMHQIRGGVVSKQFPAELVAEMYSDYSSGRTIAYVSSRYDCSPMTVVKLFRAANLPIRHMKSRGRPVPSQCQAAAIEANRKRHADAIQPHVEAAKRALAAVDSPEVKAVLTLRISHPDKTLAELGELHSPPLTKAAYWGRFRRAIARVSE